MLRPQREQHNNRCDSGTEQTQQESFTSFNRTPKVTSRAVSQDLVTSPTFCAIKFPTMAYPTTTRATTKWCCLSTSEEHNATYCTMETPLGVAVICKMPYLIESARNLVRKAPGKMQAEFQRRSTRLRASQFATPTRTSMKGPVLRFAVLAANLLLNARKMAPGQNFMWILPTQQARTGPGGRSTRWFEPVQRTQKGSIAAVTQDNDDSMWWLTRRLLPTISLERRQRCKTGSLSPQPRKKQSNKEHMNEEQWALTRALIPRKYQHPSSGWKAPVPGKPPPGLK
jgi:hypothetical protein